MSVDVQPTSSPPGDEEVGELQALPPQLAQIWQTFASRELARGRRDISNLVEVTLQFVLEHESANLKPMIANLNRLHGWDEALTAEAVALQKRLAAAAEGDLPQPYQRVHILLDRQAEDAVAPSGSAPLRRVQVESPVTSRSLLVAHLEEMQKQQRLVSQAAEEHLQALQARRGEMATRLRHYSTQMHKVAGEMVASLPAEPPPGLRPHLPLAPPPSGSGGDGAAAAPAGSALARSLLDRLRAVELPELARRCLDTVMQAYRSKSGALRRQPPPEGGPGGP